MGNIDRIDQMIWAEIPVDYGSKDSKEFLKQWRRNDDDRTHLWKDMDLKIHVEVNEVKFIPLS